MPLLQAPRAAVRAAPKPVVAMSRWLTEGSDAIN